MLKFGLYANFGLGYNFSLAKSVKCCMMDVYNSCGALSDGKRLCGRAVWESRRALRFQMHPKGLRLAQEREGGTP